MGKPCQPADHEFKLPKHPEPTAAPKKTPVQLGLAGQCKVSLPLITIFRTIMPQASC